jgi:hypothetical protein
LVRGKLLELVAGGLSAGDQRPERHRGCRRAKLAPKGREISLRRGEVDRIGGHGCGVERSLFGLAEH